MNGHSSVTLSQRSGWSFSGKLGGRFRCELSGAYRTIPSMRIEIEAVTATLRRFSGILVTQVLIVTYSLSMLRNVQNRWL